MNKYNVLIWSKFFAVGCLAQIKKEHLIYFSKQRGFATSKRIIFKAPDSLAIRERKEGEREVECKRGRERERERERERY